MARDKIDGETWVRSVLREAEAPPWVEQYRFYPSRNWRMDFAWPQHKVYLEFEGYGHERRGKFFPEVEKHNTAALDGWRLVRITTKMLNEKVWGAYNAIDTLTMLIAQLKELERGEDPWHDLMTPG
jgi:very-short-patch-repair endonuclease